MHEGIDRRRLIASAGLGLAGLALPGCATTGSPPRSGGRPCLPPVNVSADRVIRTVAGLRPYRAAGFVVRGETLGEKRLVHNYGHGGAGITLSWGSSRLATQLGLPGHQGPVAVLGAGIMGLTVARLVQEQGFDVTLYAAALPPDTTSNVAGGQWSPFGHFREEAVSPEWRGQFATALDYSWRRFQIMVGEDYGVRWLPTYQQARKRPSAGDFSPYEPGGSYLAAPDHPFPVDGVIRFETLYVETGRFLRQLIEDVRVAGGRFVIRRFATPADIAALPERLVFNCTGLGARELFGDRDLRPARGQLAILLPQPEVTYAYSGSSGYMFPRPDGILLGGTFELDRWKTDPEPETTARLLASHRRFFEAFRCTA